ncbi:hypothetical protein C8J56DRAFT_953468 [Mycena floridula]|nr:hypothetical protein C8J56DRAFT_953468 [Mycena floridula]
MLRTALSRRQFLVIRPFPCCSRSFSSSLRAFRPAQLDPPAPAFAEKIGKPSVKNHVLFFVFGSALVFSYAAFRTNLDTERCKQLAISSGDLSESEVSSSAKLRRFEQANLVKDLRAGYAYVAKEAQWIPGLVRPYLAYAYVQAFQPYADAGHGKRLCWKIVFLNMGVWVAWKFHNLDPVMRRHFLHHPLSGLSYTMVTSVFSHKGIFHLLLNCLALEGFGSAASSYLMREQTHTGGRAESTNSWHFLAFFLSAGTFSSLVSQVVTAKFKYPQVVKQLSSAGALPAKPETWSAAVAAASASATTSTTATAVTTAIRPSLGASGAIYGCVTMTALAFPESKIALIIPPSYPIDIQWGVGGLLLMDMIGILRGWKMLDHWAHLGGAAFGVAYYYGGMKMWNTLRNALPPKPEYEEPDVIPAI